MKIKTLLLMILLSGPAFASEPLMCEGQSLNSSSSYLFEFSKLGNDQDQKSVYSMEIQEWWAEGEEVDFDSYDLIHDTDASIIPATFVGKYGNSSGLSLTFPQGTEWPFKGGEARFEISPSGERYEEIQFTCNSMTAR